MRSVFAMILVSVTAMLSLVTPASAMDRWNALSMIESGDNDRAIGHHGEISRFQILPTLWPGGDPRNEQEALGAARAIMIVRLERFEKIHKRPANNFEFYVLWNAPWEANHPSKAVSERAQRFANLVESVNVDRH
jgi:hypothetical protein